jgi:hypothetical protein
MADIRCGDHGLVTVTAEISRLSNQNHYPHPQKRRLLIDLQSSARFYQNSAAFAITGVLSGAYSVFPSARPSGRFPCPCRPQ